MRDRRLPPFAWVSRAAIALLQEHFEGERLNTAQGLYLTFAALASEHYRGAERDSIEASRADLARASGLSDRSVDVYAKQFEAIGLLHVERRRVGDTNLPNLWSLTEPTQDVVVDGFASGEPVSPGVAKLNAPLQEGEEEPQETRTTSSLADKPEARRLATLLVDTVNSRGLPGKKVTVTNDSIDAIDKLNRIDGVSWDHIEKMIVWLDTSRNREALFWRGNIRSGKKLREHFGTIVDRVQIAKAGAVTRRDGMTEDEHRAAVLEGARRVEQMGR